MPLNTDISAALLLLEQVQERVEECDDPKLQMHTTQDLKALISLLEDPVFRSIVTIQDSLTDLNSQLGQHPSILPGDFDINLGGQLELSLPNTPAQPLGGPNMYQDMYQDSSELDDQRVPVARLVHSSSEDTSAQVTSPSLASEDLSMPPITTPTYAKEFQKVIEAASKGRQIYTVQLYKPEGTSLGFSVVGLRSKDKGELGIFLQEIQPNGIAGCDGRLVEGDQILAIDGQPLDSNISHEQAISILQKARGLVELVVARSAQEVGSSLTPDELSGASNSTATAGGNSGVVGGTGTGSQTHSDKDPQSIGSVSVSTAVSSIGTPTPAATSSISSVTAATTHTPTSITAPGLVVERSPSAVSDASRTGSDMVLNTEWAQVEVINLINDGSGLGFGIIGGRSTGVVVKTILPGGVADRDNRLQSGDHILQIGDVNLRGMGSEQVAAVLRQSGTHVRLVVARPVEPTSPDYQALGSHAPIVPTRILGDPDELERHLVHSVPESCNRNPQSGETNYDNGYMYSQEPEIEMHARSGLIMDVVRNPVPITTVPVIATTPGSQISNLPVISMDQSLDVSSLPEMERFTVELKKDIYGLGITIAGYVCEKEELSGIFVKSISEGSAADLSNKIQINDRIVEVDGHSLQGYSNHEAVEVLRSTGQSVTLCLERYLRGPKYETLQQAIAASEQGPQQPGSPSIASLPSFPISADGETTTEIEAEGESHTTVDSGVMHERDREDSGELDEASNIEALLSDPSTELTPQIRASIKSKWQKIVGPDTEIVVAQLKKFAEGSGLGISLEGTVDVEDGQEVRPHHYIRSILPEGPVGQNGCLRSGDELLEVNGYRLLGINHMEVVSVLKELPLHVRMVCGRNIASQDPLCPIDTAQHQAAFQTRSILGGSLQNLLPAMDRLVKAKSDGSLASTTTTATVTDASLSKMKSRSLEPLTGLAMWSSEPQIIELIKGERGLGFSILDYQDPMNPNETVIVIRSLVPGGVAQVDGQLIPGDRLLFVNDIALENATLDQAVQALKGAPKGTVRIGVAKPLPIPDSIAQLVTPICIVRRSRSLPDDSESTNQAPDLVDLADLNDLTSSKSGASGNSIDKQDPDADEEADQFEDASPLTPVHSPKKKGTLIPLQDSGTSAAAEAAGATKLKKSSSASASEKSSPGSVVPQENSTRNLLLFTDGVVPVVNVTILRELGNTTAESRSSIVKKSEVEAAPSIIERDLEKSLEIERDEVGKDFTVYDTGPSTSTSIYRQERRKSIKRQGSLVKEKSIDEEIILGKTDDSIERKVAVADNTSSDTLFTSAVIPTQEFCGEKRNKSTKHDAVEETARKLAKDRRKSLKEQKSIERVNEYLAKHSAESSSAAYDHSNTESASLEKRRKSLKEIRPVKIENIGERRQSLAVDMGLLKTSSERRKSLTKQEHVEILGESLQDVVLTETTVSGIADKGETKTEEKLEDLNYKEEDFGSKCSSDKPITSGAEIAASMVKQSPDDAESGKSISRKSSMKKKTESPSSLDANEGREETETHFESWKKEVKIQENVEEIFYEDNTNEEVIKIPEVQLVRAKIISAEEAAANLAGRVQCSRKIELNSPPEIVTVSATNNTEKLNVKTKFRKAALSAEEQDEGLLNLPGLTKSTSENILVETEEENTISGKNFKPDILLDLSKVPEEISQSKDKSKDSGINSSKDKRILSRVGSEGSKISQEAKMSSRISTSSSIVSAVPSLVVKDKSEMTSTSMPLASLNLQDKESTKTTTEFRSEKTSASEQPSAVTIGSEEIVDKIICSGGNFDDQNSTTYPRRVHSEPEPILSILSSKTLSDNLKKDTEEILIEESADITEKLEEPKSKETEENQRESQVNLGKPEVVTKTVYKSDFPIQKKNDCGYKSVNQRLREREFSCSFIPKTEPFVSKVQQQQTLQEVVTADVNLGQQRIIQQIVTTDKEAEEQRQKALEKQREHEKFLQNKRTLCIEEENSSADAIVTRNEDNFIGKEHSLEYQSQTLEARFEELDCNKPLTSSENLSSEDTVEEEERRVISGDSDKEIEEDKKRGEELSSAVEKREAETQTEQETKSTQCGTDEVFDTGLKSANQSSSSLAAESQENFGSPRKEVETQTQGETKETQCGPDDLAETFSQLKTFFRQKSITASLGSLGSPRREVEVQTEQESKSVQCTPEDIPESSLKLSIFFQPSKTTGFDQNSFQQTKKEVEVQTYQETKSTQFTSDNLIDQSTSANSSQSIHRKLTLSPESVPSASLYTSSPIIVLVDGRSDMTVTHNYKDKDGNVVWAKHWGPERMVEIYREPKSSLGLSIVGGKVDLYHGGPNTSQNISGIFIKNVLPNSPAGRTGDLKTGDRIIEVDGIDLRNSTHDRAVKAIQAAGNPVCLLVQSLVHLSPDEERTSSHDTDDNSAAARGVRRQGTRGHGAIVGAAPSTPTTSFRRKPPAVSPARTITPELIQEGIGDEANQGTSRSDYRRQSTKNDSDRAGPSSRRSSMKQSLRKKAPSPPKGPGILREVSEEGEEQAQKTKPKYSSDESSDEEDTRDLEGNVYTKAGIEISRKSAGNVKRTKEEIEADPEQEDEFGYTAKKIKKRYDAMGHPVVMVKLEKDRRGLGISLAGHKDRNRMAVFVCGLNPKGVAHKTGGLHIGDEILEVNGTVLQGRCHLNASAMIKGMAGTCFKVIALRRSSAVNDLAVKPIVQFPPTLDEDDPNRFSQYKGVRTVSIKKGQYGLGIMIIEGKHAEVGQGIFVSDIQEGSAAEQAGLQVGDMILAVNLDCLLGSSYDEATGLLKKTEGVVTLTVCNPNQSKLAKEEEDKAKGDAAAEAAKEPEKPKEPEPPKDPKDCEISVGRETTIEYPKDKDKAIGLTITGGSGTPLGGIVILEVFPEGAAGKDGRLKPGDQIIEMCHESFKAIEYGKAHEAILKANGPIHMVVFRDDKPPDEFDVEIAKKSGKGVGLCLTGFKSGKGAYVSDMLPGGSALESGKIAKGDRVVAVGGQDVREAPVEDIALHVKVSNPVQLKLARYKPVKQ